MKPPFPPRASDRKQESDFEALKQRIHSKLVDKLDLTRVGDLEGDTLRREIRLVVEHLCDTEDTLLNRAERERLIEEVLDETFGLGRGLMSRRGAFGTRRLKRAAIRRKSCNTHGYWVCCWRW